MVGRWRFFKNLTLSQFNVVFPIRHKCGEIFVFLMNSDVMRDKKNVLMVSRRSESFVLMIVFSCNRFNVNN